jgi:hypothetical protein
MRYNPAGDLAAGVGPLSVNREYIGQGFNPRWLWDDECLANAPGVDGIFRLYKYAEATGWRAELEDQRGATRIACGGGNYAVWLASNPPVVYGVWNGQPLPEYAKTWRPLEGAMDGRLLFASEDYLSLIVLSPDGRQQWIHSGANVFLDSVRLVMGGMIYWDMSQRHTLTFVRDDGSVVPMPVVDAPYDADLVFDQAGQPWACFHNEATYLQKIGTTQGYLFEPSYGPAVSLDGPGAWVATTPRADETPTSITLWEIPVLGEHLVELAPGPPIPIPVPPDPIPIPIPRGVLLMAADPNAIRPLHHLGVTTQPNGKVTYTAAGHPNGEVWSVQTDGSLQTRPKGTAGAFESFKVDTNGSATVNNLGFPGGGGYWTFVPVNVSGL